MTTPIPYPATQAHHNNTSTPGLAAWYNAGYAKKPYRTPPHRHTHNNTNTPQTWLPGTIQGTHTSHSAMRVEASMRCVSVEFFLLSSNCNRPWLSQPGITRNLTSTTTAATPTTATTPPRQHHNTQMHTRASHANKQLAKAGAHAACVS